MDKTSDSASIDNEATLSETTTCPYCAEPIKRLALVCHHCGRDFYLFNGIFKRLEVLEQTTAALARPEPASGAGKTASTEVTHNQPVDTIIAPNAVTIQPDSGTWRDSANTAFGCIFTLTAAFALLNLVFDVDGMYLRIISMGVPLAFGFSHAATRRFVFAHEAWIGTSVTVIFVLAMTRIQAEVQGIRWAPRDLVEWREIITYGCSILFAYLTGAFVAQTMSNRVRVHGAGPLAIETARVIVTLTSKAGPGSERVRELAKALQSISSSLVIIGTALAAAWTGIGGLRH